MSDETNPLLARLRLPGETFQLPSQGLFYTNGELDDSVSNGEVEIYPMTTIDEIVFSTPDKLLSGKAVVEVFERCIPQIKKPMELLTKDVDFLLICLRLVTFGQTMEVSYDHYCEESKAHTYKIDLQKLVKTTKKLDPTSINKEYNVTLPNGQNVIIQPMKYGAVLKLYDLTALQKTDEAMTQEDAEKMVIIMLSSVIGSVDGISDPVMIEGWLKALNLGWKKQLEQSINGISSWGVDFTVKQKCKDCGEEIILPITANPVSFFFQPSKTEPLKK